MKTEIVVMIAIAIMLVTLLLLPFFSSHEEQQRPSVPVGAEVVDIDGHKYIRWEGDIVTQPKGCDKPIRCSVICKEGS